MFTVGIFSTHLPYIAFVFFYAYFFIFGIQKATNGELSNDEKTLLTEARVIDHFDTTSQQYSFHYADFQLIKNQTSQKKYIFEKRIKQSCFIRDKLVNTNFSFPLFSRPPPVI